MSKQVDTKSYWMPILRDIKEFKEIANTEDIELSLLYAELERVLNNMYIETSDEYGVKRLEKLLKINSSEGDTLDQRRFMILSRWNDKVPYTDRELYNRLLSLCGKGKFKIIENYREYYLNIITNVGVIGSFDEVCRILKLMIPCNLVLEVSNELDEVGISVAGYGVGVSTSMHYEITNDLDCTYQIQLPHNEGIGVAVANSNLVTNDIQVTNTVTGNAVVTGALSTGTTIITN